MFHAHIFFILFLVAGVLSPAPAHAYRDVPVYTPGTGNQFFMYRIYDQGEEYPDDPSDPDHPNHSSALSTYTLSAGERQALVKAGEYWAEILGPAARNKGPVYFTVGTVDEENANAGSPVVESGPWSGFTRLAAGLIGDVPGSQLADDPAVLIHLGFPGEWYTSGKVTQLPENGDKRPLTGIMAHEIGHALGILSSSAENEHGEYRFGVTSEGVLAKWDEHLYDQNGNRATAGAEIISDESQRTSPTDFLVEPFDGDPASDDAWGGLLYFTGTHVAEVLQGARLINPADPNGTRLPGIPVNGWEGDEFEGSHIELINSSMSHQNYRNYSTWMEAELAILQDIGYTIDRKNFFGYSVYGDGLTITSSNGYFARNADGTAYLPGVANTASFGVGLHIYGSGNTVTQAADLLAGGVAGIGVRVDGAGNSLTIAPGTRVHAEGDYGTGLLVAYGKNHSITHQGELRATGLDGIAARFDFGDNMLGDDIEYRGSYIRTSGPEDDFSHLGELGRSNLDGPLVSRFNVTGSLTGRAAAIHIGPNALVREINFMRGSAVSGSINSLWDVTDPRIDYSGDKENLVTRLSFGYAPQADGSAGAEPDPGFFLSYSGNISGITGMRLVIAGGTLAYNGMAELISLTNEKGATLKGNGRYKLNSDYVFEINSGLQKVGYFSNYGTLSPGNSIGSVTIDGNYLQGPDGLLDMEFAADGSSDRLIVNGNAGFDGGLQFRPMRDYYGSGQSLLLPDVIQVSGTSGGSFADTSLLNNSPTLNMALTPVTQGTYRVSVSRDADAYSRYAGSDHNAGQAGSALDALAGRAGGDMRNLVAALDFSDAGTMGGALPQLSPAVYDTVSRASLDNNRMISSLVSTNMLRAAQTGEQPSGGGQVFVIPFASGAYQSNRSEFIGYDNKGVGVLGGVEKHWENGLKAGVHAVFSHTELDAKTPAGATNKVDGLHVGVHGMFKPDASGGWYTSGQLRAGMENNDMRRKVSFAEYSRTNESDWQSFAGAATWGAGYDAAFGPVTLGPVVNLDYGLIARPSIDEKSGPGSRLHIDSDTMQSLGSNLGARLAFTTETEAGPTVVVDVAASWRHELLDATQTSSANFAGYGNDRFNSKSRLPGRDSMNLQGGISFIATDNLSVSALAGGEFFRPGYSAAHGNLAFAWNF